MKTKLAVGYIELEECVAGREVHVLDVCHIPGADDDTTTVGISLDGIYSLLYLVDEPERFPAEVARYPNDMVWTVWVSTL